MLPDRVSNPGPLTYESDALSIALRGPVYQKCEARIIDTFKPAFAAMHGPHSLFRIGPGCANRG